MLEPLHQKSKESKLEHIKRESHGLRGTIKDELEIPQQPFGAANGELLKFHGIYQQRDRDAAVGREHAVPTHMIRVVIPGGTITVDQYLALDRLAEQRTSNCALRITTRQCLQLYGIEKNSLRQVVHSIREAGLTTFAGSGDVERNVMAPPAPKTSAAYRAARALANQLAGILQPQPHAYDEVWFNRRQSQPSHEPDPLYGTQYLPRKFKTGVALLEDNAVDVHSQDVGLIVLAEDNNSPRVNVLIGGGLGMTHRQSKTFARLASPLCHVTLDQAAAVVREILAVFREFGDRTDRKHARLKYLVEAVGVESFRQELQNRLTFELEPWVEIPPLRKPDFLGRHEQGNGLMFYGVHVPNGRIIDTAGVHMKTALRLIVETLRPSVTFSPSQNILFGDLDDNGIQRLKDILADCHVPLSEQLYPLRRKAVACPGLPTCGKALNESERFMPTLLNELETELDRLGLTHRPLEMRVTGCPNGCARPYTADLGVVGHKPGCYDLFVGGRAAGGRLGDLYAENVPQDGIVPMLRPLLEAWRRHGFTDEPLGDCYQRLYGQIPDKQRLTGAREGFAYQRVANRDFLPGLPKE